MKENLAKAGHRNLADGIINDKPSEISFADNIDSRLHIIPIPKISGQVQCEKCQSDDHFEYVDHDYSDSDDFKKEVRFRCMAWLSGFAFAKRCETDITIYLDENNNPIFPKDKK